MKLIWATRGRAWGFRFLSDGGYEDPLRAYEEFFDKVGGEIAVCRQVGANVALRFPDPEGRKDRAGRVIPHEFVVFPPLADAVNSVEDGIREVWPLVSEQFDRAWDS